MAAPRAMSTPLFPRPARCGLAELAPIAHTIAETISARTARIRPTVMTAPTMVRSCAMPGRPSVFGSMSICARMTPTSLRSMAGFSVSLMAWLRRRVSQTGADVEEVVRPGECGPGEGRGAQGDPHAGAGTHRGVPVPGGGGQRPRDRANHQRTDRDDERDRQERADDPGELARSGYGAEVRTDGGHGVATGHGPGGSTSAEVISAAELSQPSGSTPVWLAPPGRISKCR